ncbi:MAG: single-stranded DNA-binding protein [Bacteroidales bacterium]
MSVNKVFLLGRVGQDPDVKYLDGGVCFSRFSVATSDRAYTNAKGETIPERTEWHNIIAWRGIAQVVEKLVQKGTQVYIEGKLQTRQWEDQNGIRRNTTEILIENLEILSNRKEQPGGYERIPQPTDATASGYSQTMRGSAVQSGVVSDQIGSSASGVANNGYGEQDSSDDLPF